MQFRKATSLKVVDHVYENISAVLNDNKRVLWLVSGGSTIPIAASVLKRLQADSAKLQYLMIMQIDERFGQVGHPDSNWQQLKEAGFLDGNTTSFPILQGKDLQTTRSDYEQILEHALQKAAYKIGLFGIGTDGHTAGILPGTEATKKNASLVVAYRTPDYTRITISAEAISQLDTVIAYAAGSAKENALRTLEKDVPVAEQPAQILKSVKDSYVYNDILEEKI
jgi:6-phosphogluconolactonase/glucosamine-6-phosphate isomerase/deaminase